VCGNNVYGQYEPFVEKSSENLSCFFSLAAFFRILMEIQGIHVNSTDSGDGTHFAANQWGHMRPRSMNSN
jgi:hypothetical protein